MKEESFEDLGLNEDLMLKNLLKNDRLLGIVLKINNEQIEELFSEIEKKFPNVFVVYRQTTTPEDRLFIVSKEKFKLKKEGEALDNRRV